MAAVALWAPLVDGGDPGFRELSTKATLAIQGSVEMLDNMWNRNATLPLVSTEKTSWPQAGPWTNICSCTRITCWVRLSGNCHIVISGSLQWNLLLGSDIIVMTLLHIDIGLSLFIIYMLVHYGRLDCNHVFLHADGIVRNKKAFHCTSVHVTIN